VRPGEEMREIWASSSVVLLQMETSHQRPELILLVHFIGASGHSILVQHLELWAHCRLAAVRQHGCSKTSSHQCRQMTPASPKETPVQGLEGASAQQARNRSSYCF